jgi:transcriptional regulatory protein RtcR
MSSIRKGVPVTSPEDIGPNLEFELERVGDNLKQRLTMSREARERYLTFARSAAARWSGNFRDFGASLRRMATLCEGGRISVSEVDDELERLRALWRGEREAASDAAESAGVLDGLLDGARRSTLDRFDRIQLEEVVASAGPRVRCRRPAACCSRRRAPRAPRRTTPTACGSTSPSTA